jgi:hypothetical protein
VKDAFHLLQRFIDVRFVGQQGVCDVEVALFFGANSRYSIQCALIASIIGKAGARLEARDISLDQRIAGPTYRWTNVSLDQRISVFPQREYWELLNIEGNANSEVTCCVEN